jgi:hypothetical protein
MCPEADIDNDGDRFGFHISSGKQKLDGLKNLNRIGSLWLHNE